MATQYNTNGVILSPVDVRDYKIAKAVIPTSFPDTFELEQTKIKNQGSICSCVSFALSSLVEYYNDIQGTDVGEMSTGCIYGNRLHGDYTGRGMCVRDALHGLTSEGTCPLTLFPENIEVPEAIELFTERFKDDNIVNTSLKYRISSYFRADSVAEIKTALMNYGPVVFVIPWYNDMKVTKGVMSSETKDTKDCGYHCMLIYGWTKDGWKIQNSWGLGWGRKGRAIMPFDFGISEAWGTTDNIVDKTTIVHPWATVIGNVLAKVINLAYSLIKRIKK